MIMNVKKSEDGMNVLTTELISFLLIFHEINDIMYTNKWKVIK